MGRFEALAVTGTYSHNSPNSSCPGLTRASSWDPQSLFFKALLDARVKPGHDDESAENLNRTPVAQGRGDIFRLDGPSRKCPRPLIEANQTAMPSTGVQGRGPCVGGVVACARASERCCLPIVCAVPAGDHAARALERVRGARPRPCQANLSLGTLRSGRVADDIRATPNPGPPVPPAAATRSRTPRRRVCGRCRRRARLGGDGKRADVALHIMARRSLAGRGKDYPGTSEERRRQGTAEGTRDRHRQAATRGRTE